jgi:carbamoyl-phosphate synthase large subunit
MHQKTSVLVTGTGGGGVGEGIVKALKLNSQKYRIVATDMNPMSATLWRVDKGYIVPPASDDSYARELTDICKREKIAAVIPGSVPELKKLSNIRTKFEKEDITLIISPKKVIDTCLDKLNAYDFMKRYGFSQPKTFGQDESAQAMSELDFPVFVKPRQGYGSRYTYTVRDEEELGLVMKYLTKNRIQFLVQECIAAEECTVGVVISKSGRTLGSISMLREIKSGFSHRMTVKDVKEARETAEELASKIGAQGPLNVQFFLADGGPVVIEINPRFSGTTPVRSAVGFNEVDAVLRDFLFDEQIPLKFNEGIIAIRYLDEVYATTSALKELQKRSFTETKGWKKRYF